MNPFDERRGGQLAPLNGAGPTRPIGHSMHESSNPSALIFGEALFDCFPDGSQVLGGAPFNVAWHLQGLGAAPLLISRVGEDALGERMLAAMHDQGLSAAAVQRDPERETGVVQISLQAGEPSYEILPHRAWDAIDPSEFPALPQAELLYHGSLALREPNNAQALAALRAQTSARVFLDVNLRDPWWRREQLLALLAQADLVKLNEDELLALAPTDTQLDPAACKEDSETLETCLQLVERLLLTYGLDLVLLTRGARGALAITAEGARAEVRPEADLKVADAVGAGDGFASVMMLGLLRGWPLDLSLQRAQTFASALVQRRGATVSDPAFYAAFLQDWDD